MFRFARFSAATRALLVPSLVILLGVGVAALTGCSKKGAPGATAASGVPESELFDRLPATTFAFLFQETHSPAYREYAQSGFYQPSDAYLAKVRELSKDTPELQRLSRILEASPLLKDAAGKIQPPRELMLFASASDGQSGSPEFGAYSILAEDIDPAAHLSALEAAMKTEQLTVERRSFGAAHGLVLSDVAGSSTQSKKFFLVASTNRLSVSTSALLAERLVTPLDTIAPSERGRAALDANPVFQRARARAANTAGIFAFGFVDAASGLKLVQAAVPVGQAPIDTTQFDKSIESLAFARTMGAGLNDFVWFGLPMGAVTPQVETILTGGGAHPGPVSYTHLTLPTKA